MARNADQLTVGQERMAREISKLLTTGQQIHHKNTAPALRTSPATPRKPASRAAQAPTVR
jgi:hypothetical protein